MITDTILHLLLSVLTPILNLIPSLETFVIPDNITSYLLSVFRSIGIFIPLTQLMPLLVFVIVLTSWRFIYALINRVRSLI